MIITVTLNPAMDKTLKVDNLTLGTVNRVSDIRYDIGGKGINVSKVLKNFGIETICTGFLGGIWENAFHKELMELGINHDFVIIDGNTRTNTKIIDNVNQCFTDINEAGPYISSEEIHQFMSKFESLVNKNDIVVLSGGISPSLPNDIYFKLGNIAKDKGATVILDADGELLKEGLNASPQIIKPNEFELKKLFDTKFVDYNDMIQYAETLKEKGIKNQLISLGEKGALYIGNSEIYYAEGLKVPVKSTVGAGDSMVAALVYGILNSLDEEATLKFAVACGTVSVGLEGTQACTLPQVNEVIPQVKLKKWR